MKELSNVANLISVMDRKFPERAIELLREGLGRCPFGGTHASPSDWILQHIRPQDEVIPPAKDNIVDNHKSRWGKVYRRYIMGWDVRARVGQTEGIEITRADYCDLLSIRKHHVVPLEYLLRRARCLMGPFLYTSDRSFAVGGLFVLDSDFIVLQLFWFREDGCTVSELYSSEEIYGDYRFRYNIKAQDVRHRNGDRIWKRLNGAYYRTNSRVTHQDNKLLCVESRSCGNSWIFFNCDRSWRLSANACDRNSNRSNRYNISFEVHTNGYERAICGPMIETSRSMGLRGLGVTRKTFPEK